MYAESGLMFPYFQSFSPDVQQFDDLCYSNKSNSPLGSVVQSSAISDYDLGGEGDLFNAPEPIIESSQELSVMDMQSLQNEEFLNDVFHEYEDILSKEVATELSPLSEVLNCKIPVKTDDVKESVHPPGQISKSVSSDCLSSMEWVHGAQIKPSFLNFSEVDFGNFCGMRRAFSEGDIKTLANGNGSQKYSSVGQPQLVSEHTMEDRWQKLSRYRNKKSKRNFGRKIKYACRKALADNQPRIRGRFAKTEETEMVRK